MNEEQEAREFYKKMDDFLKEILKVMEDGQYEEQLIPVMARVLANSCKFLGVNLDENTVHYFAKTLDDNQNPRMACLSISTDIAKLVDTYAISNILEVSEGIPYVFKDNKVDNETKDTVH